MASFTDTAKGRLRATTSHLTRIASLTLQDSPRGTHIHLMADRDHATHFALAALAINGELEPLLEDLSEFCDDLADGAPDSPPYAHRALDLAARLDAVLPKAPKPVKIPKPVNEGGGL